MPTKAIAGEFKGPSQIHQLLAPPLPGGGIQDMHVSVIVPFYAGNNLGPQLDTVDIRFDRNRPLPQPRRPIIAGSEEGLGVHFAR
jgi:hypothetical protein